MLWKRFTNRAEAANHYAREFDIHPLTAQILLNRGLNGLEVMRQFLTPGLGGIHDPYLMRGMENAVRRIRRAVVRGERIHVHGDYDVDGISATAVLVIALRSIGGDVHYHISSRGDAAVGLGVQSLKRDHLPHQPSVIITADCGTSNREAIELAKDKGVDVIVVDHHHPGRRVPKCNALLNPMQRGCSFPFKNLAAVGVAFNLVLALKNFLDRDDKEWPDIPVDSLLDLVALGTVADVVPLVDENRVFVGEGLKLIQSARRPGICALMRSASLITKDLDDNLSDTVSARTIGFRLAPLINAAGRMGDANKCVELLVTDSYRVAVSIGKELEKFNTARQERERELLEEALQLADRDTADGRHMLVLAAEGWHPGVLGIVASRLVERYGRPALVAAIDEEGYAKGSVRSPAEFDMLEALQSCRDLLETYGGHRVAAGVAFRATHHPELRDRLNAAVVRQLPESGEIEQTIEIDAMVNFGQLNRRVLTELSVLAPFGAGNPEPVLEARNVQPVNPRVIAGGNLRMRLRQGNRYANAFGPRMAERLKDLKGPVDIVFSPRLFGGSSKNVELYLKDIKAAKR